MTAALDTAAPCVPGGLAVTVPAPRGTWTEICDDDPRSLADQRPEWIDAICGDGRYQDASRLYSYDDGRAFVLPLVRRAGPAGAGGSVASPPAGWGIGGLVGEHVDRSVVEDVLRDLRGMRVLRCSIRPDPLAAEVWSGVGNGAVAVPRRAHVVDLSGGLERVESAFSSGTRRNLRRAEREGVTVELDRTGRLLPVHHELFLRSVERWAAKQHEPLVLARWRAVRRDPLDKLHRMAHHLGDRFWQLVASHEGRPVASIVVLIGRSAHYTRGAMDVDLAGPVRANELLHATAMRAALAEGCTAYHMGESGGSESLARFKEKLGAEAHDYAEYRFERLPVTRVDAAGRAAVKRIIGFRDA